MKQVKSGIVDPTLEEVFIRLAEQCFPDWPNERQHCLESFRVAEMKPNATNEYNLILKNKDVPVAFGSMLYSKDLKLGYIHNTGTLSEYRRQGYFSKLIDSFMQKAWQEKLETIFALTEKDSASYKGLNKLGFRESALYHLYAKG